MKVNPNQFKVGDSAILDKGYSNQTEVIIRAFTFEERFARISTEKDPKNVRDVMTTRLSPIYTFANGK